VAVDLKRRKTVRFLPRTASILLDGSPQKLGPNGELTLTFHGAGPLAIRARAVGHRDFSQPLTYQAASRRQFVIRLEPDSDQLAAEARLLLKRHCYRCHGVEFELRAPGLDVLARDAMVNLRMPGAPATSCRDAPASRPSGRSSNPARCRQSKAASRGRPPRS
jgi:hypothetical protein